MSKLLLGLVLGLALGTVGTSLADSLIWGTDGKAYFRQQTLNPYQAPLLWEQPGRGAPRAMPQEVPLGVSGGRPC